MNNNRGSNNNHNNNNRRRGRGNTRPQGGGQQINRIDSRARGNAPQMLEKYRKLAHDAHLNGDRVTEEYNLQYADHYFRVIADQRQRQEEFRQARREERPAEYGEEVASEYDAYGDVGNAERVQRPEQGFEREHRQEREPRQERDNRYERGPRQGQDRDNRYERGPRQDRDNRYEQQRDNPYERDNREQRSDYRNEQRSDQRFERTPVERAPVDRTPVEGGTVEDVVQGEATQNVAYEPAENPFVRDSRGVGRSSSVKAPVQRRPRTPRVVEASADVEADFAPVVENGLDEAALPPAIAPKPVRRSAAKVAAAAAEALSAASATSTPVASEEPVAEEKPRRRRTRKVAADDAAAETVEG